MQKYIAFFQLGAIQTIKNFKSLIGLCLFMLICLVIFAHLWKVVSLKAVSFNSQHFLWYIAFNEWVLIALPETHLEIENDLKKGYLSYLLPRPISYLGAKFTEAVGVFTIQYLVLGAVSIGFVFLWTGVFPLTTIGFFTVLLLGFLSGSVAILFQMIIGITAFWLLEVAPVQWIWEKFLFMLGGLFLPIAFFPKWLQALSHFTPFPMILGDRSALIYNFEYNSVIQYTLFLLWWAVVAVIALKITYARGIKILHVEGG
jgi:ABC-2 type transport system permease protein